MSNKLAMNSSEEKVKSLVAPLPDPESAVRFYSELSSRHGSLAGELLDKQGLLSDLLTLASFSPLLATTLLQNPEYITWLEKRRADTRPRSKEELLEGLSAFSMNDDCSIEVALSRFKRREFLRVFLLDIKRLVTISETTDEISHLADAILEFALTEALRTLHRRFGKPMSDDGCGRFIDARFTVVSLGKLGSRELNYSSDIDLLFIYSSDGNTSGGDAGAISNKEFFIKLSESLVKLVGTSSGEGAAYRVDMRLRPHGRVGPLAISLNDVVRYYVSEARPWEKQMLIRARSSAGNESLFKNFMKQVRDSIFSVDQIPEDALRNVRISKEKIDKEQLNNRGFNVKLGIGGIREIEFIAQALQLAHGATDKWIRTSHTIIALSRLTDRGFLTDEELVKLKDAYEFLRQLEHVLQMEHGLQTHTIPQDEEKQFLVAKRMGLPSRIHLIEITDFHTGNVSSIFRRIFGEDAERQLAAPENDSDSIDGTATLSDTSLPDHANEAATTIRRELISSLGELTKSNHAGLLLDSLVRKAPRFAEKLIAMPWMFPSETYLSASVESRDEYLRSAMRAAISCDKDFPSRVNAMRKDWAVAHFGIVCDEVCEKLSHYESKRLQTVLAESSIESALILAIEKVLGKRIKTTDESGMSVLGLGKLGGRGIDFGSDLDLVLVYDEHSDLDLRDVSMSEVFSKISESFVAALSSITRDGQMYRVDLRLRPDGKNGPLSSPSGSILEYFKSRAAIWELLAYLKVRFSGGADSLGKATERSLRSIILERASNETTETLSTETLRIRERLFQERCGHLDQGTLDIKFGRGGLLDIYFASRFLQLANGIDEIDHDRSTARMIERLKECRPDLKNQLDIHAAGYEVLSRIDHALRLSQGRSTRLSLSNSHLSRQISEVFPDFPLSDIKSELPELMASIRRSFEEILHAR